MNSRERINLALNHKESDRIPYDLGGTTVTAITNNAYVAAMKMKNIPPDIKTAEIDPIQQIVIPSETNLELLKVDTRRIGAQRLPGFEWNKVKNNDEVNVTDMYGCDWKFVKEKDLYFNQASYPLQKYGSLTEAVNHKKEINWDAYRDYMNNLLDNQVVGLDDFCVIADRNSAGLTECSLRIRGYEEWYMDTMIDPIAVESLLEKITDDKIRYWDIVIDWAIKNGKSEMIQVVSECDDLGSQENLIIDPNQLRSMVIPRFNRIFSHVKKRLPHVKIFMHSCGAIREVIPDLIDAGLDILNPVQFTATGMELKGLKKDFGKDITFWGGGVDTQSTLNNGTPQQVRDEVKKILDIMAPGGGFVFAPVHNIQDDVTPENFWAMWETLQEYAKY